MSRLRVGLLGCGHIAPRHAVAWRRDPRFELVGVFDLDRAAAEKLAGQTAEERVFGSTEELVAECEIVDICTPPASHFELSLEAMAAERHLVVEKPLVVDLDHWRELDRRLRNYSKSISVVHHLKFTRAVRTAKRWLEEGRLGRLLRIDSSFATHPAADRMLGGGRHWSHELPGGRWFETLPHNLYLIHHLAGELALDHVSAIRTETAPQGLRADEVAITLSGPDSIATIHLSANCRHNYRWVIVTGTLGVLRLDLLSGAVVVDRVPDSRMSRALGRLFVEGLSSAARLPADRTRFLLDRLSRRSPQTGFVEALGDHLLSDGPAPTPVEEIRYVVENCYRIGQAIETDVAGS